MPLLLLVLLSSRLRSKELGSDVAGRVPVAVSPPKEPCSRELGSDVAGRVPVVMSPPKQLRSSCRWGTPPATGVDTLGVVVCGDPFNYLVGGLIASFEPVPVTE